MKKLSKLKKLTAVFGAVFFVVIMNAVISYSTTVKLYHQHSINDSLQAIIQLERSLTAFNNTETYFRTYLVTNNQKYLTAYLAFVDQTQASLEKLQTLSYATDLEYINLLKQKIANSFKTFDSRIKLQKTQNQDLKLATEELFVEDIQAVIEKIIANSEKQLQTRVKASQISFGSTITAFSITTLGNIGLIGLFYFLLRSTIIRLNLTEQRLTQSQNRYLALWNAGECIELIAQDTTLLEINASGVKMMEVDSANKLLGQPLGMKVEQEYKEAFAALHESVCRGNCETSEFEIVIRGTRRWVETHAVPLLNESDGTFLNLSVTRDITARKQLEAQLLRLQRLDTIGSSVTGIVHDLNNVLSASLLSAQLLKIKLRDSEYQQLLKTLENNIQLGASLVKQVLSFARGNLDKTVVELTTVLSELSLLITQTFPKSITFQSTVSPYLAPVFGNRTQIQQVLMNLVVNARDAMPLGGKLTLAVEQIQYDSYLSQNVSQKINCGASTGDYILITVIDTGIGIPASIKERIFEPFFTTKENGKGTGLGLSTTKTIINNHGGFIDVESIVGKGTCFKVYLPAQSVDIPHSFQRHLTAVPLH